MEQHPLCSEMSNVTRKYVHRNGQGIDFPIVHPFPNMKGDTSVSPISIVSVQSRLIFLPKSS